MEYWRYVKYIFQVLGICVNNTPYNLQYKKMGNVFKYDYKNAIMLYRKGRKYFFTCTIDIINTKSAPVINLTKPTSTRS